MDVIRGYDRVPAWSGSAVAIGNFDGVHVGHRALIQRTRELAGDAGRAVVLTFDPHPAAVVGSVAPPRLASLDRRIELLAQAGVDAVVIEPFTRELAGRSADAFIDDIVVRALRAHAIVVGYDFSYGHARAGTTATLCAHGARAGITVQIVPAVDVDGLVASSSKIRTLLRAGELESAAALLGRSWDVDGVVVHGAKRGRAIGVPTANIAATSDLPIAPGIYAVTLELAGERDAMPAVASLGTNPTFVDGDTLSLEVHVLDWTGDLYGRTVRTSFVARLRDELKFDSVDALIAQIRRDIDQARRVLRS